MSLLPLLCHEAPNIDEQILQLHYLQNSPLGRCAVKCQPEGSIQTLAVLVYISLQQ